MALDRGDHLKHLLTSAEPGQPLTARWLGEHGVSPQLAHHYVRNGWLDRLGRGHFIRKGDRPALERSLAVGVRDGHVGGKTALAWHGYRHNLYVEERVFVYSHTGAKVASWISLRFPVEVRNRKLFGRGDALAIERSADGVPVSEPERAVLEMLADVPGRQSVEEAENLVDMLQGLRPARMEAMLKDCLGVKTVRLFLALARRSSLPVLDALDLSDVRLGAQADYVMRTPGKAIRLKRS